MSISYRLGFWYVTSIGTSFKGDGVNLEPAHYSMRPLARLTFHIRMQTLAACLRFLLGHDSSYKRVGSHIQHICPNRIDNISMSYTSYPLLACERRRMR